MRGTFERWWKTPSIEAVERHKLYKLAWDITGTEFAGRHMLYEKFYAGSSIVVEDAIDRGRRTPQALQARLDIVGTEFAGRHMLYEKFYAGSSIVVRNQSDREAPWQSFHDTVDRLLARSRCRGEARHYAVMAGTDPAIHHFAKEIDPRVKPAGDA